MRLREVKETAQSHIAHWDRVGIWFCYVWFWYPFFAPNSTTFRKEKLAWSLDWKVHNKFILQKLLSRDETEKSCTSREGASNLPLFPWRLWKRTWLSSTLELMTSFDGSIRSSVLWDPQPQNRKWSCFQEKWSCPLWGGIWTGNWSVGRLL